MEESPEPMTRIISGDWILEIRYWEMAGSSGIYLAFGARAAAISDPEKSPGSVSRLAKILEMMTWWAFVKA